MRKISAETLIQPPDMPYCQVPDSDIHRKRMLYADWIARRPERGFFTGISGNQGKGVGGKRYSVIRQGDPGWGNFLDIDVFFLLLNPTFFSGWR
jgi:hypothetical protein